MGYTLEQLHSLYLETRHSASADRRFASAERRASTEDRLEAARDRDRSAADRRLASLDPLTGAYNRAAGFEELRRDITRARRDNDSFTLAFLDVDGLKTINDTHGHAAGDRALMSVVQALSGHLRGHDLIIRFGGDEFLCGVASMDEPEVNKRLALVAQSLAQLADQVHVTVGLATLVADESIDELFARADAAFYALRKRR